MFKRAKKYLTLQMLAAMEPQKLTHLSEQKTLKIFARGAADTPAYRKHLKEQGVNPEKVKSIDDFKKLVPFIDKDKTFRLYSREIKKLCLLGEIKDVRTIICSSGYSGCFSYGLNTQKELKKAQESIDFLLDYIFGVDSRKTLFINGLPMGIKVHSSAVTVVDTSVRSDIILGLIKTFSPCYDQIILIGENSFVKKVLEDGLEEGINWNDIRLQIILGEEILPENLRTYMASLLGIDLDDKDGERLIGSSFGVAEFGLNVFYETRELIRLRRLLQRDDKLKTALIGRDLANLPALFHYNPLRVFVEESLTSEGLSQIVLTNLEEDTNIPLIRYNIEDEGMCLSFGRLKEILESGAIVSVVAEKPSPEIERLYEQGKVKLLKRRFRAEDTDEAFLVFAATDDTSTNAEISAAAKKRSVLVNTVDCPEMCDFISGAVVKRGPLQIAISTNGQCPAIASTLRGELEQLYTAYAHKSYSTCQVKFTKFLPTVPFTTFCCGIRKIMSEYDTYQKGGLVVSMGKNIEIRIPDEDIGDEGLMVDFEGIALVVRDRYKPEYRNIKGLGGNHVFRIPVTPGHSFEYMILGGWSEGAVNKTEEEFKEYTVTEALKYNNPPKITVHGLEKKE